MRLCVCLCTCNAAAGDLWLLNADDASTLLDAVMESFRIQDRAVSTADLQESCLQESCLQHSVQQLLSGTAHSEQLSRQQLVKPRS